MGFFSELKSDLSQAVNTLMPDDKADETRVLDKESVDGETVRPEDVDLDSMLDRLDEIKLDDVVNEEEGLSEESEQTLDNSEETGEAVSVEASEEESADNETSDNENTNEGASDEQAEKIKILITGEKKLWNLISRHLQMKQPALQKEWYLQEICRQQALLILSVRLMVTLNVLENSMLQVRS